MWLPLPGDRLSALLWCVPLAVLTLAAWTIAAFGVVSPKRAATARQLCELLLAPVVRAAEARGPTVHD